MYESVTVKTVKIKLIYKCLYHCCVKITEHVSSVWIWGLAGAKIDLFKAGF